MVDWDTASRSGLVVPPGRGYLRPGLDFHSFRHTATTLMHQAGIEHAVLDHLTGHVTPGETSRYTKGSILPQLARAIESIRINVDFSALYVGSR
jgi:integrase